MSHRFNFRRFLKLVFPLLVVGAIVALTPLPALASTRDVGETLLNILTWLLQHTLVPLATLFLNVSSSLFDWVLSPQFNQIPLTHGLVVNSGWTIMRDFANMLFIAAMIIMSFSTILGVEGYGWRQALPRLIAAALLINFSKFFAGLIVDMANIIILFFVQNGIQNATNPTQGIGTVLAQAMGLAKLFSSSQFLHSVLNVSTTDANISAFLAVIMETIFLWIAAITLLLLAITLIMRIIRIWLLVIFAPLVALAAIFPFSQHWWRQWLQELVKWSFMGVSIAFFVYLAAVLAQAIFTQGDLGSYIQAVTNIQNGQSPDSLAFIQGTNFIGEGAPILIFILIAGLLMQARSLGQEAAGKAGGAAVGLVESLRNRATGAVIRTGRASVSRAGRATVRIAATSRTGQRAYQRMARAETAPIVGGLVRSLNTRFFEKPMAEEQKHIDAELKSLKTEGVRDKGAAIDRARTMLVRLRPTDARAAAAALYLDESKQLNLADGTSLYPQAEQAARHYGRELKSMTSATVSVPASMRANASTEEIEGTVRVLHAFRNELSSTIKDVSKIDKSQLSKPMAAAMLTENEVKKLAINPSMNKTLRAAFSDLEENQKHIVAKALNMSTEQVNSMIQGYQNILENPYRYGGATGNQEYRQPEREQGE